MTSGHRAGNVIDPNGISPTILDNHGYPALVIEEIKKNDMNQLIQVAQIYDKKKNPTNGRVYDPCGISPTLTTPTGGNSMPLIMTKEEIVMNSRLNEMEQIPFNTADNGLAYTITTRYGAMCASNLKDGNFPMTGILTIDNPTEDMKRLIESGILNFDKGMPKESTKKTCAMRGRGTGAAYHQEVEVGDEIANALTTVQKDSMVLESAEDPSIHPNPMVMADPRKNYGKFAPSSESSPTLLSTDYKSPHLVMEASMERIPIEITQAAEKLRLIAAASRSQEIGVTINPDFSLRPHKLNKAKDGISEYCIDYDESIGSTNISARPNNVYGKTTRFRIRKLTPRECYRLMDMPEENIDRLLSSGISKSQHYKLAGNSIVVACLYHIFKNLFTNEIPKNQQLSLF